MHVQFSKIWGRYHLFSIFQYQIHLLYRHISLKLLFSIFFSIDNIMNDYISLVNKESGNQNFMDVPCIEKVICPWSEVFPMFA